jgi:hypothetical protein
MSASSMPSIEARQDQDERLKRSEELVQVEQAIRSLDFVLLLLKEKRKALQKRVDLIQKSIKRNEGRGGP